MRFATLTTLLMVAPATAFGEGAPLTTSDGVFTEEQAKRGEAAYRSSCSRCHGGNLQATDAEAANLSGPAFDAIWIGTDLRERFERVYYTMPPNNPGSLSQQQYLDIVAYILHFNGVPAGDTELPLDLEYLATIEIVSP